jgi:hypothetical protein
VGNASANQIEDEDEHDVNAERQTVKNLKRWRLTDM